MQPLEIALPKSENRQSQSRMINLRIPAVELTQSEVHIHVLNAVARVPILHQMVIGARLCDSTLGWRSSASEAKATS